MLAANFSEVKGRASATLLPPCFKRWQWCSREVSSVPRDKNYGY